MRATIEVENEEEIKNVLDFVAKSSAKLEVVLPQKKKAVKRKRKEVEPKVRKKRSPRKKKEEKLDGEVKKDILQRDFEEPLLD